MVGSTQAATFGQQIHARGGSVARTGHTSGMAPGGRGFTLIELLVVLGIIVIVIAITLPAIAGARRIARTTATQALMTELSTAIQQFRNDNNETMPGAFTPAQMGSAANANIGLTAMENAMIDLAGANAITQPNAQGAIELTPGGGVQSIWINPALIGTGTAGVYFTPGANNFVAMEGQLQPNDFPDLVDAFGNPIMLWVEDLSATRVPTDINQFAAIASANRARFYWNSNAGFLNSTQLGQSARNQSELSLLGGTVSATERIEALAGLAGDPASPTPTNYTPATILPSAARGSYILQSAGADGVFLARADRGARTLMDGRLRYRDNFFNPDGTRWTISPDDQRNTTVDVLQEFNDVFVSGK